MSAAHSWWCKDHAAIWDWCICVFTARFLCGPFFRKLHSQFNEKYNGRRTAKCKPYVTRECRYWENESVSILLFVIFSSAYVYYQRMGLTIAQYEMCVSISICFQLGLPPNITETPTLNFTDRRQPVKHDHGWSNWSNSDCGYPHATLKVILHVWMAQDWHWKQFLWLGIIGIRPWQLNIFSFLPRSYVRNNWWYCTF